MRDTKSHVHQLLKAYMQQAFGILVILGCMIWGGCYLAEMFNAWNVKDGDKIDRCPHCGDWVRHGEDSYVDDNDIYHGYCWDKSRGDLKGILQCQTPSQ